MKKPGTLQNILHDTKKRLSGFQSKLRNMKKSFARANDPPLPQIHTEKEKKIAVEISASSVARSTAVVLLLLVLAYFLYQISNILLVFFISFLFAAALDPIIDFMQKRKVPRAIGVLMVYLFFFVILGVLISKLVPLMAKQVVDIAHTVGKFVENITSDGGSSIPFARELKPYFDQLYQAIDLKTAATQIQSALQVLASQLLNISFGLVNVILVLVLTFFMTVEEKSMQEFYLSLFPSRYGNYISTRLEAIKQKIGYWLRGQLLLSLVAGVLSYIGLLLLNVQYALTLSVIAAITMVIPVIGRIFALIFTVPIVLNQSPILALWVSVYYFILQQIEVNILAPYIMNKAVGLSPIIIIFAMLVGAQYLGIVGLIISIPIATSVAIFVKDYMEKAK